MHVTILHHHVQETLHTFTVVQIVIDSAKVHSITIDKQHEIDLKWYMH